MYVNISQIGCYPNYNKIYECLVPLCRKEIILSIMDFNNPKNNLNISICKCQNYIPSNNPILCTEESSRNYEGSISIRL